MINYKCNKFKMFVKMIFFYSISLRLIIQSLNPKKCCSHNYKKKMYRKTHKTNVIRFSQKSSLMLLIPHFVKDGQTVCFAENVSLFLP